VEAVAHVDDHTQNPILNSTSRGEFSAYVVHSGGKDHVASNIYKKDVTYVSVVNVSSI
jgi:hypothetical protein